MQHHSRSVDARLELAPVQAAQGDVDAALATLDMALLEADTLRPSRQPQLVCAAFAELHAQRGNDVEVEKWRAQAQRETTGFDQERAVASRELDAFWKELERYWPS